MTTLSPRIQEKHHSGRAVDLSPFVEALRAEAGHFETRIDRNGPEHPTLGRCWRWLGRPNVNGYGNYHFSGHKVAAHRIAYLLFRCLPTPSLTLDHLCRNRMCVNPDHLEEVTNRENVLRGRGITAILARKTHCDYGHEFTPENTHIYKGLRRCRKCMLERQREQRRRLSPQEQAAKRARRRAVTRARRIRRGLPVRALLAEVKGEK